MKLLKVIIVILITFIFLTSCSTNKSIQTGHDHIYSTTWSKNETKHWKECSCGEKIEEANHTFGEWKEIEKATTQKEGLQEKVCSICNYKFQEKIPMVSPIFSWRAIDLFQPTAIVGGKSDTVLDERGNKVLFTDLVDRQIDMLAQEIISRLEYVYGDSNEKEIHAITDSLHNNETFTTYNSMNVFSDSISSLKKYSVYDSEDNYVEQGYIMTDAQGEQVLYDNTKHSHYIKTGGEKYAAICNKNVAGNFTSPVALQLTFEALEQPTITHDPSSYYHEGILTFHNAIYGTPMWEYEDKLYGTQLQHEYTYNENNLTPAWNWAEYFKDGSAKTKLKSYLAYIIVNNITNYNDLKNINVFTSTYQSYLTNISSIKNHISNYFSTIFDLIMNELIGVDSYRNDLQAGLIADSISNSIFLTSKNVRQSQASLYYEGGYYKQLYTSSLPDDRIIIINRYSSSNLDANSFFIAKNYKAYDTIIHGILNQISKQSAYLSCQPLHYEEKEIDKQVITLDTQNSEIYLFLKNTTTRDIRIGLSVPYETQVTLTNANGSNLSFTKEKDSNNQLVLKLSGSSLGNSSSVPILDNINGYGATSSLEELLKGLNYIKLTLYGVDSFRIETEEYVQIE